MLESRRERTCRQRQRRADSGRSPDDDWSAQSDPTAVFRFGQIPAPNVGPDQLLPGQHRAIWLLARDIQLAFQLRAFDHIENGAVSPPVAVASMKGADKILPVKRPPDVSRASARASSSIRDRLVRSTVNRQWNECKTLLTKTGGLVL